MERLQASEAATLVIGLIASVLLLQELRQRPWRGFRRHLVGSGLILAAGVFTIAEGYVWPQPLNFVEHLCLMLAGFAFLGAVSRVERRGNHQGQDQDGTGRGL
jgi:hypothetical protein